ncbi:hypothetical protein KJ059_12245 [Myxococcota bacterium]|nr:hypothetical protein [Myxococcota bacterium]MCZ7619650.1 hypothetical protein [Myxococcota bacterium]
MQTPEEREANRSWQQLREWRVPVEVNVEGERLVWRYKATRDIEHARGVVPVKSKAAEGFIRTCKDARGDMLERFLSFADPRVGPARIAAFARRFGVFHHHGKPGAPRGHDVVRRWRDEARLYSAILAGAADLRDGLVRDDASHWPALADATGREVPTGAGFLAVVRFSVLVQDAVQRFVVPHVPVTVATGVDQSGWRLSLRFGGGSLRGALCAEVLRELQGRERRQVACDGCGDLHAPRGQAGRRSFCRACHASGAPVRFAKRDLAARRARARAAASRGASLEEAARAAYGVRDPDVRQLETVDGWISKTAT